MSLYSRIHLLNKLAGALYEAKNLTPITMTPPPAVDPAAEAGAAMEGVQAQAEAARQEADMGLQQAEASAKLNEQKLQMEMQQKEMQHAYEKQMLEQQLGSAEERAAAAEKQMQEAAKAREELAGQMSDIKAEAADARREAAAMGQQARQAATGGKGAKSVLMRRVEEAAKKARGLVKGADTRPFTGEKQASWVPPIPRRAQLEGRQRMQYIGNQLLESQKARDRATNYENYVASPESSYTTPSILASNYQANREQWNKDFGDSPWASAAGVVPGAATALVQSVPGLLQHLPGDMWQAIKDTGAGAGASWNRWRSARLGGSAAEEAYDVYKREPQWRDRLSKWFQQAPIRQEDAGAFTVTDRSDPAKPLPMPVNLIPGMMPPSNPVTAVSNGGVPGLLDYFTGSGSARTRSYAKHLDGTEARKASDLAAAKHYYNMSNRYGILDTPGAMAASLHPGVFGAQTAANLFNYGRDMMDRAHGKDSQVSLARQMGFGDASGDPNRATNDKLDLVGNVAIPLAAYATPLRGFARGLTGTAGATARAGQSMWSSPVARQTLMYTGFGAVDGALREDSPEPLNSSRMDHQALLQGSRFGGQAAYNKLAPEAKSLITSPPAYSGNFDADFTANRQYIKERNKALPTLSRNP